MLNSDSHASATDAEYMEAIEAARTAGYDEGMDCGLAGMPIPDLSGEWAGCPTPQSLLASLGLESGDWDDDICTAWEEGAADGWDAAKPDYIESE